MKQYIIARSLFAAVVGGMLTCGCSSSVIQTPTLSASPHGDYIEVYEAQQIRHSLEKKHYLHPLPKDTDSIFARARVHYPSNAPINDKHVRDYVQNELLKRSDQICTAYMTRLVYGFVVGGAGVQIGQSLLKLVLAPAVLADSAFQAASGNINLQASNEILQHERFMDVNRRILDRRATFRSAILEAQGNMPDKYSFSRAMYDAELYHSYCNYATQLVAGESPPTQSPAAQVAAVKAAVSTPVNATPPTPNTAAGK